MKKTLVFAGIVLLLASLYGFLETNIQIVGRHATIFNNLQNVTHLALALLAFTSSFFYYKKSAVIIMIISTLITLYTILGIIIFNFWGVGFKGLLFEVIVTIWSIYNYKVAKRTLIS